MDLTTIIKLSVSAVAFAAFLILYVKKRHDTMEETDPKKIKKKRRLPFFGMVIAGWYFVACAVNALGGRGKGISLELEIFSPRVQIGPLSVARTTVTAYCILLVVAVLCVLFRLFVYPKFKDEPKGLQNALEAAVEFADSFTENNAAGVSPVLSSYMLSVAILMIGCAFSELFGQRPPTSDVLFTFSLALCTFYLIKHYAIRKKHLGGFLKSLASPSPLILPMKVLTDVAEPVSLACRLFGNMLGGMITMDLLKNSLGGYAVGVTSLAGLYFNLFHPLIQTYIFIVLSLTFIREATE